MLIQVSTRIYFRHRKHGSMIGQRNKTVLFMLTNRLSILGLSSIPVLTNALLEIFQKTPVSENATISGAYVTAL